MKQKNDGISNGVSDVISVILIVILVIGLAAVITAFLMPGLIQKSVYIASEVSTTNIAQPGGLKVEVLSLLPKAGDPFYITGQQPPKSGTPVSIRSINPAGNTLNTDTSALSGVLYGETLYIYPKNTPGSGPCELCLSDKIPVGILRTMEHGRWTIQFVDENAHILVMSNNDGEITGGSTSLPQVGGTLGGATYWSNCSQSNYTPWNNPPVFKTNAPMNMTYRSFNGIDQYLTYPNDPSLNYANDLSISIWLRPGDLNSAHQIIGKGIIHGIGNEDDNYQMFTWNNKIYFEWNNVDNSHYHLETNTGNLSLNNWNYVTLTVNNGEPQVYLNGKPELFTKFDGNTFGQGARNDNVKIQLKENGLPVTLGKQNNDNPNYDWNYFYKGDMGSFGIYDRALTPEEIWQNNQTYNA